MLCADWVNEMKREMLDKNFIIETFDSFGELLKVCDERKRNFGDAREEEDEGFTGVKNYAEARNLLEYGYDKNVEFVKKQVCDLQKKASNKRAVFENDVVGFAPVVPNAILGLPHSMINQRTVAKKAKVVTVLFNAGNPWKRTVEEVIEYGAKFVNYVINLEKQGYRVKIDCALTVNSGDKHYILRVPVKKENNFIDLKRICFPLTHPAMQRCIGFDWYERLPDAERIWGYGKELCTMDTDARKRILERFLKPNEYFVCYGDDLDEVFGQKKA